MHSEFNDQGLLRLPGVLTVETVSNAREQLWREIGNRFGIQAGDPATWFSHPNKPAGDQRGLRLSGMNPVLRDLQSRGALNELTQALSLHVGEALGPTSWKAKPNWYSLVSFPGEQSDWNVPHRTWHADEPVVAGHMRPWTVFAFVFLAPVAQFGGGTTVVTGSHRCGERLAARDGRIDPALLGGFAEDNSELITTEELRVLGTTDTPQLLAKENRWFKSLLEPGRAAERRQVFMEEGELFENIPVKVTELSGDPGDIILLDPRCLHSISVNTSGRPREILRLDFRRLPEAV